MIIKDGLIENKCHGCGETWKTAGFDIQHTYLWSNQHGKAMRFFCHRCGAVHDVTQVRGELTVKKHTMRCSVFSNATMEGRDEK